MNLISLYFSFVAIWLKYNCFVSLKDFECQHPGFSCDCANPKVVYYCTNNGPNLLPDIVDTCNSPQVCDETSEGCTDKPNSSCSKNNDYVLDCPRQASFPDPYDCRHFYNCEPDITDTGAPNFVARRSVCPLGKGYEPASYNCYLELNSDGKCPQQPIPTCTKLTDPKQIASNPPMYYMCKKAEDGTYQPKFTLCLDNQIFISTGCVNSTTTTTTTSKTPTTTAPTTCKKGDTFLPDPSDCRYYYNCGTSATRPSRQQCPPGTSFNKKMRWCQEGLSNCV